MLRYGELIYLFVILLGGEVGHWHNLRWRFFSGQSGAVGVLPKDFRMIDWIYRVSRWTALAGGLLLVALMLMVVISVIGRALIGIGLGPVPGDFELVEIGVGIAVFFFMPWCYVKGGSHRGFAAHAHAPLVPKNRGHGERSAHVDRLAGDDLDALSRHAGEKG